MSQSLKLADVESNLRENTETIAESKMALQAAVFNGISEMDVADIVKKQVEKAKEGDVNSAKFVLSQVIGSGGGIKLTQNNVYTDVETAAKIAKKG